MIRGGYGIFYGNNLWNPVRNDLANVYPFTVAQTLNKNTSKPELLTLQNPLGVKGQSRRRAHAERISGVFHAAVPAKLEHDGGARNRQIDGRGGGVHRLEGHAHGAQVQHQQPYRVPAMRVNGSFPRPISGFNDLDYYSFGGNSSYNAGMVTLRKRMARGFFYRLNYVYSKSIDTASQIADSSDGGIGAAAECPLSAVRARTVGLGPRP